MAAPKKIKAPKKVKFPPGTRHLVTVVCPSDNWIISWRTLLSPDAQTAWHSLNTALRGAATAKGLFAMKDFASMVTAQRHADYAKFIGWNAHVMTVTPDTAALQAAPAKDTLLRVEGRLTEEYLDDRGTEYGLAVESSTSNVGVIFQSHIDPDPERSRRRSEHKSLFPLDGKKVRITVEELQ